jgi:hypothetical protein
MSYSGQAGYNQQLKLLDIQVIQAVYLQLMPPISFPRIGILLPLP